MPTNFMSEEQQQLNHPLLNEEDRKRVNNAFFAKTVKPLPLGVIIGAVKGEQEIDLAISNADIADIYNAINGESPYGEEDKCG
jgi:hypothetical protein